MSILLMTMMMMIMGACATAIPTKRERRSQQDLGIQMFQVNEHMRRKCCRYTLRSAYGSTVTALNKNVDFIYGSE